MDQIITLNKTFQDRLTEYNVVFGVNKLPSISDIKKQWTQYLEIELNGDEDVFGLQAFWKIPHFICAKNNVPYPTIVLVQIIRIDYNELKASIEIIAIQGEFRFECIEYNASLLHLWPTKQQHTFDVVSVANSFDTLRFFYNNVLMPWDYLDLDCDIDIEERLYLFYNIKENKIAKSKTVKVRALLRAIQNELEHFDRTKIMLDDPSVELQTKIIELKVEYELLQIPMFSRVTVNNSNSNNNWLVFRNKYTLSDHIEYMESVKLLSTENVKYKMANSLGAALDLCQPDDVIFLSKGRHLIDTLKDSVVLRSVSAKCETILDTNKENALIEFMGDKLILENIHLNVSNARCAIITHCGEIVLKNCVISAARANAEHAIIALPGSRVQLQNCKISGFNVALYASANSFVTFNDCHIFDVVTAIKMFDESKVCLCNCSFRRITRDSVYFETKNESTKKPCITMDNCTFDNTCRPTRVVVENNEDIFNLK